jgi:hypothetical protein
MSDQEINQIHIRPYLHLLFYKTKFGNRVITSVTPFINIETVYLLESCVRKAVTEELFLTYSIRSFTQLRLLDLVYNGISVPDLPPLDPRKSETGLRKTESFFLIVNYHLNFVSA